MGKSIGFFDETADVFDRVILNLRNSSDSPKEIRSYLELVARIFEVLAGIHDEVAEAAVRASFAETCREAKDALEKTGQIALKGSLKTQDLCAELRQLGSDVRPLAQKANLSDHEQSIWEEFCGSIEKGEGETARLYDEKLYDLSSLPCSDSTLGEFKTKVDGISQQLVNQKSRFDLLAKRATALRDRL